MIIPFTKSGPAQQDAPSETNMLMALAEMQKQGRFDQQDKPTKLPKVIKSG